jgi:hypothetical protein
MLISDVLQLRSDDSMMASVTDIFARKSTATLHKRADCMMKFIRFCSTLGTPPFPVREDAAYVFVKSPDMSAPTAAQQFREALGFSAGTLGLDGAVNAASSARVSGASRAAVLTKRILKQAVPWTVRTLQHVLIFMANPTADPLDKVLMGQALACVTLRSRWNDMLWICNVIEDFEGGGGYLQFETNRHKTATTAAKKTMMLPMVGPLAILGDCGWYDSWIEARRRTGLIGWEPPLMRVPNSRGTWTNQPLRSSEATSWIKEVLGLCDCEFQDQSTHSLKSVYLSWAAKYGLELDDRSILGYHVIKGRSSTFCYGRDNMAAPLRKLDECLREVTEGTFLPDSSRSGRFPERQVEPVTKRRAVQHSIMASQPKSCAVPTQASNRVKLEHEVPPTTILVTSEDERLVSSSEDSSSEQPAKEAAEAVHSWHGFRPGCNEGTDVKFLNIEFLFHVRSHVLHIRHEGLHQRLRCGRCVSHMYEELSVIPDIGYPECVLCFKDFRQLEPSVSNRNPMPEPSEEALPLKMPVD